MIEPTELSVEIYLGDDSDCETCGSSYNRLYYTYTPTTREHRIEVAVGCHGGDNLTTTDGTAAAAFVTEYAGNYRDAAADLTALVAAIEALGRGA